MSERIEAVEEQAVRDASAVYSVEPEIAIAEDVPPGYKWTEVGVIPEDWGMVPIRDLGTVVTGSTPPTSDASNYGDYLPFATPVDIGEAKYIRSTLRCLSRRGAAMARRFPIDSILFVSIGSTIGKCGMAPMEVTSNQQINAVLPGDRCHPDYFYYAISIASDRVKDWAGTQAVPIVNKSQFSETRLPLPDYEEQRAIATALSDADALIESLDRLIAKKRAIKQAAMQQLLTGQTRLPGFTGEWGTKQLGEHVTFLKTGTNSRSELSEAASVAYLHYGDIHVGTSVSLNPNTVTMPRIDRSKVRHLDQLEPGDLVFVDASEDLEGVGKSVEIVSVPEGGMVAGLHTIAARFDKDVLADGFKAYLQFIPQFIGTLRRLAAGTKVLATNKQHIASVEMAFPGVLEQQAIATVLSDMDAEIEALERRRDKTREVKQGMMQQLLTGRVRLPLDEYEDVA